MLGAESLFSRDILEGTILNKKQGGRATEATAVRLSKA